MTRRTVQPHPREGLAEDVGTQASLGFSVAEAEGPAVLSDCAPGAGELLLDAEQQQHPCDTLSELLAQCDALAELTDEDRAWAGADPIGDELI